MQQERSDDECVAEDAEQTGALGACGAKCFTCVQGCGEAAACCCLRISPATIRGAKRCGTCAVITLLLAIGLIVQAIIIPALLHKDLVSGLEKSVLLDDPTTPQFARWQDNSANPLLLSAYVYHIKNPAEMLAGAKPDLVEMGPYFYRAFTRQYDIQFGENRTNFGPGSSHRTLFYKSYSWYEFAPELSVGSDLVNVTTINMPFVSMRAYYEAQGDLGYFSISSIFTKYKSYAGSTELTRLFNTRTVHEVLFGWEDDVIKLLSEIIQDKSLKYRGFINNYASFQASLENPHEPDFVNQIYTGIGDGASKIRNYLMWHNQTFIASCIVPTATDMCGLDVQIPAWHDLTNGSQAASLRGNDGSVFPTPINDQSRPTIYFSPLLRSFDLEFKQSSEYKGVPLLQFGFPSTAYYNAAHYPPNKQYDQLGPNGLANMSFVQGNIPIFVSNPRFAGSDPALQEAVQADYLDKSGQVLTTIFEIEPNSGVTFHVKTCSQINIHLSPLSHLSPPGSHEPNPPQNVTWFADMKPVYLPVVWVNEEGGIDNADAKEITTVLDLIKVSAAGLAVGIVLAAIAVVYIFLSWRAHDLESNRHLSAVRTLIGDNDTNTAQIDGSSLLDSSILVMQPDYDSARMAASMPRSTPGRKHSHLDSADIDISYTPSSFRPASFQPQKEASSSYQQD